MAGNDQAFSGLGAEAVVLDLNQGMYFGLDPMGTFIWQLIQEPTEVTEVCAAVLGRYKVEPERCERDVLAFLNDLASEGLITVEPES